MKLKWVDGSIIKVKRNNGEGILIQANKEGLRSLINHLNSIIESDLKGTHLHLDEFNGQEEESDELVIEKLD